MKRIIVRNQAEAESAFRELKDSEVIGCDTETSSLNSKSGRLYSIQFSNGEVEVLIPISEGAKLYVLSGLLEDAGVVKVFHNARFDLGFLDAYSLPTRNIYCTMTAEKILTKGANQSVSLAETVYRYFGIDLDKGKREVFTGSWDGVWTEDLIDYALSDVAFLPRLMAAQTEWMKRLGVVGDYEQAIRRLLQPK
jgi:ribonuclease D